MTKNRTQVRRLRPGEFEVTQPPATMPNNDRFVPEIRQRASDFPTAPLTSDVSHRIDVRPTATQHIEVRTDSVDRAKGFLLSTVPLYAAYALGMVLLTVLFVGVPFWSFWSLVTFWITFVVSWGWGYRETLMKSAEGIAYMEAKRKWDVIEREQDRRWDHYDRLMGDDDQ